MTNRWILFLPLLILFFGPGCASSVKKAPAASVVPAETQEEKEKAILERIDRNTAAIRDNKNENTALQQRLKELEDKVDAGLAGENTAIQEIKESVTFLNDQVLRMDNTMRSKSAPEPKATPASPKSPPKAVRAFKTDGFDIDESYRDALASYNARKFDTAIAGFTEILTVAPSNKLAVNAQYWIGECYYSMKNYDKALEAFNKILTYRPSNKTADAHAKLGMTYMMMGNKDAAREELNTVISKYPQSNAAKIAAAKLEALGK
jgi:tol-pal system protein YbgF